LVKKIVHKGHAQRVQHPLFWNERLGGEDGEGDAEEGKCLLELYHRSDAQHREKRASGCQPCQSLSLRRTFWETVRILEQRVHQGRKWERRRGDWFKKA